ncbi:MAG: hypothetical protein QNL04_15380 [SAR324 cluster bacterium]|nr:hypothetical protein [SAR324 cluster bacterium]
MKTHQKHFILVVSFSLLIAFILVYLWYPGKLIGPHDTPMPTEMITEVAPDLTSQMQDGAQDLKTEHE